MIQIQDDNFNQSTSAPNLNQATQNTQSIVPDQKSDDSKDKGSEIDKLLTELDQLSKNLDEKPINQAPSKETIAEEKPVVSEELPKELPVDLPKELSAELSTESPKENTSSISDEKEEKFDFDGFLSDLEKKIDQASDKQQDDGDTTDFRKNRSTTNSQIEDPAEPEEIAEKPEEIAAEPEVEIAEESKLDHSLPSADSEELKAQNIFDMLGLMSIEDEEKNQFLNELESMIWDDFVTHDLELLLTSEEYAGAREILDAKVQSEAQQKENLIAYLEKLIPDLDEVLYDKALELKSEMMGERLAKMKESADGITLAKIKEVEGLISQNRWKSAVSLLNQLS